MAEEKKTAKKVKVTIFSGEDAGDKGDVFLSHNYKPILIQRDQEVEIEECYLECLKNSVIETTMKDKDGNDVPVKIPRFSYAVSA